MKKLSCRENIDMAEHLQQNEAQTITHIKLKAGQAVPEHHVPFRVAVIPIKGEVAFSSHETTFTIQPGDVIVLEPDEKHWLKAVSASDVIVVKSKP